MASKTYTAEDWRIGTYTPELGSFVLDFSQLNGPDILGTTGGGFVESPYEISSIIISEGSTPDSGMFLPVSPSNMSVEFLVKDFTVDDVNNFFVGTLIQAIYSFVPAANLQSNQMEMFYGIIESVNVSVEPGSDYTIISVTASAISRNVLNAQLAITKNETDLKGNLIKTASVTQNVSIDCDAGSYNFKGTARESKSVGDWVTDLALCDFMQFTDYPKVILTYDVSPGVYGFVSGLYPRMNVKKVTGTSEGTLNASNINAIQLDWSGSESPTGVTLTNYTDSTIVYQYGSTQNDNATVSYSATVDLKDLTQMTTLGQEMLTMTKAFRPVSVTVSIAQTYQTVDFREIFVDGPLGNLFIYPENFYFMGDTITIDLPDNGINNQDMIIVGRTIEVTPDNWTTTYNLWKGFN